MSTRLYIPTETYTLARTAEDIIHTRPRFSATKSLRTTTPRPYRTSSESSLVSFSPTQRDVNTAWRSFFSISARIPKKIPTKCDQRIVNLTPANVQIVARNEEISTPDSRKVCRESFSRTGMGCIVRVVSRYELTGFIGQLKHEHYAYSLGLFKYVLKFYLLLDKVVRLPKKSCTPILARFRPVEALLGQEKILDLLKKNKTFSNCSSYPWNCWLCQQQCLENLGYEK